MNDMNRTDDFEDLPPNVEKMDDQPETATKPPPGAPPAASHKVIRPRSLWLLGLSALLPLAVSVAYAASQHNAHGRQVMRTAEQQRYFVPTVRVAKVRAADGEMTVSLPGTTLAFASANIFARANGYIETRKVDIGDRVKAGDLLAQITAPELDHQIAQAEATLSQDQATLQQTRASRELARVTNDRDSSLVQKGWVTAQQGDTDRLTLDAQQAAIAAVESNIAAQEALIRVLRQQKAYQSVVAPFDGIITQRNVDTGSLVQSGTTFMFTLMQSDVIRTQVYVPQDAAFGVANGVDAVVHVPENPDRTFPGKVTRFAHALAPGTRTLLTEIDVPNPDGALSPGMYVTVELHIPRKTPSIIVPADALVFSDNGVQVAVTHNGIAHFNKVTVARDFGTEVEVRDGIKPGDEVILKPAVTLADGSKVQSKEVQLQTSQR
jgi:RND family efflux transporter MFP subunit